jgi:hypothetical protein
MESGKKRKNEKGEGEAEAGREEKGGGKGREATNENPEMGSDSVEIIVPLKALRSAVDQSPNSLNSDLIVKFSSTAVISEQSLELGVFHGSNKQAKLMLLPAGLLRLSTNSILSLPTNSLVLGESYRVLFSREDLNELSTDNLSLGDPRMLMKCLGTYFVGSSLLVMFFGGIYMFLSFLLLPNIQSEMIAGQFYVG